MQAGERLWGGLEKHTEWGQTVVHDDVLAAIAARAALTVPGVVQMSQHGLGDNLNSLVRHDLLGRGVKVAQLDEDHYTLELYVVVEYGLNIRNVCRQVAQEVNDALKDAVGLYPDQMVIQVEGIRDVGK